MNQAVFSLQRSGGPPLVVTTDIAQTPEEQRVGLNGRRVMPFGAAMLFPITPGASGMAFSLRETPFPLDILWIGPGGHVVGMVSNAPARSPAMYSVPDGAAYALELATGQTAPYGITPGALLSTMNPPYTGVPAGYGYPAGQAQTPPATPPPSNSTGWWVAGLVLGGLGLWEWAKWSVSKNDVVRLPRSNPSSGYEVVRRRKEDAERKSETLKVLVTSGEKVKLEAAATNAKLSLSTWLRRVALEGAEATAR